MANQAPIHSHALNRARDYYNPLRGLEMARLVRLLEEGERGMHGDVQWLYRMVEKRDATVKALKTRRLSALSKLDWNIKIPEELPKGFSKTQAEAQAELLHEAYSQIENLPAALEHLALASFRGFAHLEKHHQDGHAQLPVVRLEPVPQWHWVRDPMTWAWKYDARAENSWATAVEIDRANFIIRELDDPINEIAVLAFLRKNMSQKDWDSFVEDFGIPSIFAMLGEQTPPEKVKEWLAVMEKVTGNSRGALPPGSKVATIAHGGQGETPFKQHKDEQREEVVLAGTGGLLSMLTASTGLNSEQAKVHESAFEAIAIAEAMNLSALLQAQFDKPLLAQEFPSWGPVAYFELAAQDQEDMAALAERLVKLAQAGLECDENEISEKMGLKLRRKVAVQSPSPSAPSPQGAAGAPFANRSPEATGDQAQVLAELSAAERRDQEPLLKRLAEIAALEDDGAWLAALRRLEADKASLYARVLAAGGKAEVFTRIYGTALATGLIQGREALSK
jgi:phage gp29-like protein